MNDWDKVKNKKDIRGIYLFNKLDPQFNYEEAMDILLEKDTHGSVIYYFFKNWENELPKKYKDLTINKILEKDKGKVFVLKIYETWKLTKTQKDKIKNHLNFNKVIYEKFLKGKIDSNKAINELKKIKDSSFWIEKINKHNILRENKNK